MRMQRTPEKKPLPRDKKLANAAVIGMSALLVAGGGYAALHARATQERNAAAAEAYVPAVALTGPEKPEAAPPSAEMASAIEALKDTTEPWTMTVVGDSTGNDPKEWVRLVAADLANETGRPLEIHTWDLESDSYDDPTDVSGQGEPIVLWNGSASGKKGEYSLEHIEEMAPERPDLLVINHGHNQINAGDATSETNAIADWVTSKWDKTPTVAVTLQNPSLGEREDRQAGVVRALRSYWGKQDNVVLIDTWTAYDESDDIDALLGGDKLHPSEQGSKLWAETAWEALSFDSL